MKTVSECKSLRYNLMVTPHLSLSKLADIAVERKKREIFYSFKPMAGGFYSSVIGLFDSFCFSFFDLIYFSLLGLFDCQFVLNLAKFFIILLYASSNGFGEIKVSVQLNRLEKVIDRSTADGGDGSYRLQSLMVLHVTVMEFLLQTMVTSQNSIKLYGTVISLTLLLSIEQYKELSYLSGSYWSIKKRVTIVLNSF